MARWPFRDATAPWDGLQCPHPQLRGITTFTGTKLVYDFGWKRSMRLPSPWSPWNLLGVS